MVAKLAFDAIAAQAAADGTLRKHVRLARAVMRSVRFEGLDGEGMRGRVGVPMTFEELAQDLVVFVLREWDGYDSRRGQNPGSWMYMRCKSRLVDLGRRADTDGRRGVSSIGERDFAAEVADGVEVVMPAAGSVRWKETAKRNRGHMHMMSPEIAASLTHYMMRSGLSSRKLSRALKTDADLCGEFGLKRVPSAVTLWRARRDIAAAKGYRAGFRRRRLGR